MAWRLIAAATATLAVGCSTEQASPAGNDSAAAANAASNAAEPATDPVTMRFNNTMTGQPLSVPPAPIQLVVTRAEFPSGHLIACHRHVWSRYVYLEAGAVRVTNYDAGTVNDFAAGQVLAEAIGQWHDARITSPGPAVLIVVDQVPQTPPDGSNSVPWAPPPATSPCTARPPR